MHFKCSNTVGNCFSERIKLFLRLKMKKKKNLEEHRPVESIETGLKYWPAKRAVKRCLVFVPKRFARDQRRILEACFAGDGLLIPPV